MSPATKAFIDRVDAALWLIVRRLALRWLRKLVDVADDRLHAAEVSFRKEQELRNDIAGEAAAAGVVAGASSKVVHGAPAAAKSIKGESWTEWEARRSGVAPISKKAARRRRERMTAAAFDVKYAR